MSLATEAGIYMPDSLNHGKVVYKKQEKSRGRHAPYAVSRIRLFRCQNDCVCCQG